MGKDNIQRAIEHLWPHEDAAEIRAIVDGYGARPYENERERVQFGILKLSEGNMEKLAGLVKDAKTDYRDILAYAEFPEEMKTGWWKWRWMGDKRRAAARQRDREQYEAWLASVGVAAAF